MRCRRTRHFHRADVAVVLLGILLAGSALAKEPPHEWNGVPRIVAVGDVHGAHDSFVAILRTANLVDSHLRWIGGEAHLVQTGDIVDRGPDSRKTMELLMELEKQAKKAGGRVHALIGNHEAMNIVGLLDAVSPEEFASYADERALVPAGTPRGYAEHRAAFAPTGRYGRWILTHPVAVRINGIIFSHGDFSEQMSRLGIAEINRRVRRELRGEDSLVDGVAFHAESPLQFRGLSTVPREHTHSEGEQPRVDRILQNLGARMLVVGHTVTRGVIEPRFRGKLIGIDVGMLEIYDGGHRVALEIEGEKLRAIHSGGKVEIKPALDETAWHSYLSAVSAVDPDNRTVRASSGGVPSGAKDDFDG